jgi:hypothetical protein
MTKQYLGENLYVDFDGEHIVVKDYAVTQTIYLKPWVWRALVDYVRLLGPDEFQTAIGKRCVGCGRIVEVI